MPKKNAARTPKVQAALDEQKAEAAAASDMAGTPGKTYEQPEAGSGGMHRATSTHPVRMPSKPEFKTPDVKFLGESVAPAENDDASA